MCAADSPQVATGERGLFFDYNNDDYWDPPNRALPWWTANLNRFVCPNADCNVAGGAPAPAARPGVKPIRPKTKVRRSKRKRDLWRVQLHVTGTGRAEVDVRCRKRPSAKESAVLVKRYKVPRRISSSVRCAMKPAARARRVG